MNQARIGRAIGGSRLPALTALVLLVSGCSGATGTATPVVTSAIGPASAATTTGSTGSDQTTSTDLSGEAVATSADGAQDPPTGAGTTTAPTSIDPTQAVGHLLVTHDQLGKACSGRFGQDGGDLPTSGIHLLPGARALLACQGGQVLLDVLSGQVRWSRPAGNGSDTDEQLTVGQTMVWLVATTRHPAAGLADAYVSRTLTAVDLRTGTVAWTAALEPTVPRSQHASRDAVVVESGGRTPAHPQIVVVRLIRYSAFDARTGAPLWQVDDRQDSYLGFGVSLDTDVDRGWAAYDTATGHQLWKRPIPSVGGAPAPNLIGRTIWQVGSTGYVAVDLRTGRLATATYPKTWHRGLITPERSLVFDGTRLQAFSTTNFSRPLWSAPADDADPLVITSALAVVQAPGGLVVLDAATGATRTDITLPERSDIDSKSLVDGLEFVDAGILELAPPEHIDRG